MFKVQSNKFKVQSNKSSENISQRIFYLLIGLAVLVFGLFFLVGYDMPFVENPDFNAPLFTDVLIVLMWLFLIGGVGLAVYSMIKEEYQQHKRNVGCGSGIQPRGFMTFPSYQHFAFIL